MSRTLADIGPFAGLSIGTGMNGVATRGMLAQMWHSEVLTSGVSFFYAVQAASLLTLWVIVAACGCGDFYRHAFNCTVALRPSWLPHRFMLTLVRNRRWYLAVCYSLVPLMAWAACQPTRREPRVLVAFAVSWYHLAESSVTFSHRDYLMLYNAWGVALLPATIAEGFALGLCVHFIASSGLSKIFIGGSDWVRPGTMRSILQSYGGKSLKEGGPFSQRLNRLVCSSDTLATAEGALTVVFECVAVPLVFVMPVESRFLLGIGMLLIHAGIGVLQSTLIGLFFLPNIASYFYGFGAHSEVGSPGWLLALLLCAASVGSVCARRRLLPEDWPITPFALFGWSGQQWDTLFEVFVTGNTRLVLSRSLDEGCGVVGLPMVRRKLRGSTGVEQGGAVVYDAWDLCLGETTVQLEILEALDFEAMRTPGWDASTLTSVVEEWLVGARRLIELRTGEPLLRAYFVKVAMDDTISEVLATGTSALRRPLLTGGG